MAEDDDGSSDFVARMTEEVNSTPLTEELFMELMQISFDAQAGKLRTSLPIRNDVLKTFPPARWY